MKAALIMLAVAVCLLAGAVAYHAYQLDDRTTTVKHDRTAEPANSANSDDWTLGDRATTDSVWAAIPVAATTASNWAANDHSERKRQHGKTGSAARHIRDRQAAARHIGPQCRHRCGRARHRWPGVRERQPAEYLRRDLHEALQPPEDRCLGQQAWPGDMRPGSRHHGEHLWRTRQSDVALRPRPSQLCARRGLLDEARIAGLEILDRTGRRIRLARTKQNRLRVLHLVNRWEDRGAMCRRDRGRGRWARRRSRARRTCRVLG